MSYGEIEKNIPMTRSGASKAFSQSGLIASKMDIGDSVLCDSKNAADGLLNALRYRDKVGSRRQVGDRYRVWRVK